MPQILKHGEVLFKDTSLSHIVMKQKRRVDGNTMSTAVWEVSLQGYPIIIILLSPSQSVFPMGKQYHYPTSDNDEIKISQEDSAQLGINSFYKF